MFGNVNDIKTFGNYKSDIGKLKKDRLISHEKRIFFDSIKSPILDFKINIKLSYVKMNNEFNNLKK